MNCYEGHFLGSVLVTTAVLQSIELSLSNLLYLFNYADSVQIL